MNLVLSFVHPRKPARTVGPLTAVRLDADSVRELGKGTLLALQRDHVWEVGGERYYRVDSAGRVRVHFERGETPEQPHGARSRTFGPFERFSAVDGVAYADGRLLAFVDGKLRDWFCYDDGQRWPVMVVADAGAKPARNFLLLLTALVPAVAGVFGLWDGPRLLYLGRAANLRASLEDKLLRDPTPFTVCTWEVAGDPAPREAELLGESRRAARSAREAA